MSITSIKKRARAGTLEVEHLLKEANYPDETLAAALEELSTELQWHTFDAQKNEPLYVPLATWAKVVSTYCREGFDGLIRLCAEPELPTFVLALFEELRTKEALDALMTAFGSYISEPCRDCEMSARLAATLNLMLSFKPSADADASQAAELRAFLRSLYSGARDDHQRSLALLALRGIGDEDSAKFALAQSLDDPWQEVPKLVAKHIRNACAPPRKVSVSPAPSSIECSASP
ncbi:hypothetical protein [Pseudoduganella violacea]|uniref:HEAT repeat domain-containing protein n=1 Tax=Pseudoduganella violacea TaxID=1715466 RepID=A0A7W5BF93_9BURK|nr:hypothetical protein [Pseudoduganella violacea]MBB3122079.1 hypothetical protein [Pseudoduganella violacea]